MMVFDNTNLGFIGLPNTLVCTLCINHRGLYVRKFDCAVFEKQRHMQACADQSLFVKNNS